MFDWLAAQAKASPENTALICRHKGVQAVWSYAELNRRVNEMCRRLAALRIPRQAFIALHLPNSAEMVVLIYALARLGLRLAALNTRLTTAELGAQLKRLDCVWLVGDGSDKLVGLAARGCNVLALDDLDALPEVDFAPQPFNPERIQGVIFTSGTTGAAKGAQLTFGNHFWNALGSAARLGMLPADRWLSPLPLCHVGGQATVFRCCLFGSALVLPGSFDLTEMQRSLEQDHISLVSLTPTMLYRLLTRVDWNTARLRAVLLGGAAANPELLTRALEMNIPVALTYGLTEAASQAATASPEETRRKPGSVGKGLMNVSIRVVDEHSMDLPSGEIGELAVAGPTVMAGYYGDPQATAAAIRQGWLYTGDLGYLDADDDLWVIQRRSDLIVSGGENIYPAEVENVLRQHLAITDACVVGAPDAEWGQRTAAMIAVLPGKSVTETELLEFCRVRLAGYKLPRLVKFVDALPHTASGKVDRRSVQMEFAPRDNQDG